MATLTITINTNDAQDAAIKKAMEWRAARNSAIGSAVHVDPSNVPTLTAAKVKAEVRDIMLRTFKFEVKSELFDKRRAVAEAAAGSGVDDIE